LPEGTHIFILFVNTKYTISEKRRCILPTASGIPKSVTDQADLTAQHIDDWLEDDVFTVRWWVLVGIIIISLAVWFILLDKSRLKETLLFTAIAIIAILGINEYGEELILWDYPTDIIPIFPPLTSANLFVLPLAYSLTYQYCNTKWRYTWAVLILTAVMCFVMEPLLSWGDLYKQLNWQYWWSYPFYAVMALIVRKITKKAIKIEQNAVVRR
jgi:hypothetical protein